MKKNKKIKKFEKNKQTNAVMYTRVATIDQSGISESLIRQEKSIEEFAAKKGYKIVERFGGQYSSNDLQEVQRMLKFIKDSQVKISYVLVETIDRISRGFLNVKSVTEQLHKIGVKIISVSYPNTDVGATDDFTQNISLLISQFEEDRREQKRIRDKANKLKSNHWTEKVPTGYHTATANGDQRIVVNDEGESIRRIFDIKATGDWSSNQIIGIRKRLRQGYWIGKLPLGFETVNKNEEQKIIINLDGRIIRKAFYMKATGEWNNAQIAERISDLGLNISAKRLKKIFKNPFYCGLITHPLLLGEVIQGKQEVLIPREVFIQINNF